MGEPGGEGGGRDALKIWSVVVLVALAGFVVAYQFVEPAPPKTIVLATGNESGAYHAFGLRYAEELAAYGITVELTSTAGSGENVELLRSREADVAFVQGGTLPDDGAEELEGIASVYYEPLWIFHRAGLEVGRLTDLAGRRLAVGEEGSGTRAVATALLGANGVNADNATLLEPPTEAAVELLLAEELDAAFLVISPRSEAIAALMEAEGERVTLMDVDRHLGYERTFPFLAHVVLAEGVLDLALDVPDREVDLVAPTAGLVAHEDLHPALVPLFIRAAEEIHGGPGVFAPPETFPSPDHLEVELAVAAREYFENGFSFLYRVLPFPLAAAIDRLKIMLLPLLTLLLPLLKVAPPLYQWRIRSKIYRWYGVLRKVEQRFESAGGADVAGCIDELRRVGREIDATVRVPASYMEELYNLRMHLARVQERMGRPGGPSGPPEKGPG